MSEIASGLVERKLLSSYEGDFLKNDFNVTSSAGSSQQTLTPPPRLLGFSAAAQGLDECFSRTVPGASFCSWRNSLVH